MGIWKDQLDMMKAATSPEMRQLVGRANAMERPSMLDGIRQANALMEQTGEQQRLLMSGIPGRARIDAAVDTGVTLNEQPVAELTLTVEVPGMSPYQVVSRQPIPRLMAASFAPGQTVPVKVDPANPTSLTVDLAGFATAAGATPGATPIVPSQSPAERLERLAGLRDRGILTESEFAAQKARILAEL
jgi:hypothetical protein